MSTSRCVFDKKKTDGTFDALKVTILFLAFRWRIFSTTAARCSSPSSWLFGVGFVHASCVYQLWVFACSKHFWSSALLTQRSHFSPPLSSTKHIKLFQLGISAQQSLRGESCAPCCVCQRINNGQLFITFSPLIEC